MYQHSLLSFLYCIPSQIVPNYTPNCHKISDASNSSCCKKYFFLPVEAYLGPCQTSMMELLTKIIHNIWAKVFKSGPSKICGRQLFLVLNYFRKKSSTSGVWHCPIYASELYTFYDDFKVLHIIVVALETCCKEVSRYFLPLLGVQILRRILFNKHQKCS